MHRRILPSWVCFLSLFVSLCVAPASAEVSAGLRGAGFRGGLSVDPDQIVVGGHLDIGIDLGDFADELLFMPNLTLGFGDHRTIVSINPDLAYTFPVPDIGALYVGGLFTLQWIKWDLEEPAGVKIDDTDTEIGLHAIGGLIIDSVPLFFELNVGLEDAPDLKAVVGYTVPF